MGALEYEPALLGPPSSTRAIEVAGLVDLANKILAVRTNFGGVFSGEDDRETINDILRVGTSAGGARAKAILAWNRNTNEFRSGQVDAGEGYEYWIMKFDGITSITDMEVATPKGYGKIEYAYHLMAVEAGIQMTECRLHHEGARSHFMTKRFDRSATGRKLHMQSLGAMAHYDYRQVAGYSYEQAIQVIRRMNLSRKDVDQMVLRAVFNVVSRNCDDHVKNIAFLMNRKGEWCLSPGFDISYAWNPDGQWTSKHQMSINGKRDGFEREDLIQLAKTADIKTGRAEQMVQNVIDIIRRWPDFAEKAGVNEEQVWKIKNSHRTNL
jgi:serine/threonine-protein kinase HipA